MGSFRNLYRPALTIGLALLASGVLAQVDPQAQSRIRRKLQRIEHPPDEPDAAWRHYQQKRTPTGEDPTDVVERYEKARRHRFTMPRYSTRGRTFLPSRRQTGPSPSPRSAAEAAVLGTWEPLGPGNIGGRTRALLIDPQRPETLYAAGVSGGIWKTTNGGMRWRPLGDDLENIAVSAMAMSPSDSEVLYAGTGEGYFREVVRGTALPLRGGGIYKSVDGERFSRLLSTQTPDFYWVNDLAISGRDSRTVYAATRSGVWRSLDAGMSWQRTLLPGVNGGCLDLALRADRPTDVLFAACGTFEQATVYRNLLAEGEGEWQAVLSEPGMGRTSLALSPSNPEVVYALAASYVGGTGGRFNGGLHAFFRSTQGGSPGSWTAQTRNTDSTKLNTLLLSNPVIANLEECGFEGRNRYSNLGWHTNVVAVDPVDPNVVWAGGVDLFRSDDGGRLWGPVTYWFQAPPSAHADQHVVAFHPGYNGTTNQTLFLGNDGGVWRTQNARGFRPTGPTAVCDFSNTAVTWEPLNHNLGITQFYHGLPFPDGRSFLGGTQDNGTLLGSHAAGLDGWSKIHGGDGGYVAVDPHDPNVLYVESQNLRLVKSVDGGKSFEPATRGITESGSEVLFITPFAMDPGDSQTLWTGGRRLWRTTNAAQDWVQASAPLAGGGQLSAIAIDPSDSGQVLVGLHNGFIHRHHQARSTGAQSQWPQTQPRSGFVSSLAIDPQDSSVAYATYANFGGPHVWKSTDRGAGWSAIDGTGPAGLPDIPVHSLVVDPTDSRVLYLGTDLGVFVSTEGGNRWAVENTGFAATVTEALAIVHSASDETGPENGETSLFAFTHGRGAWRVVTRQRIAGSLDFAAASRSVGEKAGSLTLGVRRSGGADGAVTVDYRTADGTATAGADYVATSGTLRWADGDTSEKTLTLPILDDSVVEGDESLSIALHDPTGGAGLGPLATSTLTITDNDIEAGVCTPNEITLCLRDERFKVQITWRDFAANTGPGRVEVRSTSSGIVSFFSPDNWEMLLKVLDGCALNDHYWVFLAATTNVEYTVTVTDLKRGERNVYNNPLGTAAPAVTDTRAFATCP